MLASAMELASVGQDPTAFAAAAVFALLVTLVPLAPFLIFSRTRRWALIALGVLWLVQLVLLMDPSVLELYWEGVDSGLPWLAGAALMPGVLLLWRRTRRVGLVLLGTSVIASLVIMNYYAQVICSIGYVLLLLALWPRWRLAQSALRERERTPVVPSRGVLRVRAWPACTRHGPEGFTLVTSLVGITCLLITVSMATQMIAATVVAVRRADHMAAATDLLESARERSLLGRDLDDVQTRAARLLPKGQATVARTRVEPGLTRVTAVASWREAGGKPGQVTLEWLTPEGPR